ncbi:phosphoglycerate mutase [Acrasis kona]|uniref:Phosphoglycerate mutase n=1 Tax=Acrasis kona TaxID=1008807 RepID=A0AAW2ZHY1_9EUKA
MLRPKKCFGKDMIRSVVHKRCISTAKDVLHVGNESNSIAAPTSVDLNNFEYKNLKPKEFRILLLRHAQSEGNVDKKLLTKMPDHAIPLSKVGMEQSKQTGQFIKQFYKNLNDTLHNGEIKCKARLWTSPYLRAKETGDIIMQEAGDYISDQREHVLISEQQFGLFEGYPLDELEKLFPREFAHFTKQVEFGGRFWARPPLGESRFDVSTRGVYIKSIRRLSCR